MVASRFGLCLAALVGNLEGKAWSRLARGFLGAALALSSIALLSPRRVAADPVVKTDSGPVRGSSADGIDRFLGIPYAAPPVGDLRWKPPQPVERWYRPLDATQFANHCPQVASWFGSPVPSTTEDCLYLNVFTPSDSHGDHGEDDWHRLPVMVWIHGGSYIVGMSDSYDPTRLVEQGVVVVTINYRLGALGFLAHPALTAESPDRISGNYAILDQQAALRWVQSNIGAFGGDPFRVTIFGESSGGGCVHSQLASPLAAGLFQRAIVHSGASLLNLRPLAAMEALGIAYASQVGCADQSAACLRSVPVDTLLRYQVSRGPTVDGKVLTQTVANALASGTFNQVPVLEGTNHDEYRLFVPTITEGGYVPTIAGILGVSSSDAAADAARYPLVAYSTPTVALATLLTDGIYACNGRKAIRYLSQYVPTFAYELNDQDAPMRYLAPTFFPYGAAHASELQYLFDITAPYPGGFTPDQDLLAGTMVKYWTNFAKSANPNGEGVPDWPIYTMAGDVYQSLASSGPIPMTSFAADHQCGFWAPIP